MTAKVMVIGLDAGNATLLERWADQGYLPNFAALRARAAAVRLSAACMETLPGAIWSDIVLGEPAFRHGQYFHPEQFFSEEGRSRRVREDEINAAHLVWAAAGTAGRRCAIVDVPFIPLIREFNGIQIRELAVHDLSYGPSSQPPELLPSLLERHGHPAMHAINCDRAAFLHGSTALYGAIRNRIRTKSAILSDLLQREHWDLFFAVYGETHCAAHYLWPTQNQKKAGPATTASNSSDVWERLRRSYMDIDAGIGDLVARAGTGSKVILFTSHGVGAYLGGPQLLDEVLRRLGLSDGCEWLGRRMLRSLAFRLRLRHGAPDIEQSPVVGPSLQSRLRNFLGAARYPQHSGRCRAFAVRNNRIGAIRLNIQGRDAFGTVPRHEADALLSWITAQLRQLRDPRTGEFIVKTACRPAELFGQEHSESLPDLLVKFRTDLGPLEYCSSPAVGTVYNPIGRGGIGRSGDHVPQSRAWITGASIRASRADVLDLSPTILDLLDVAKPPHMTGSALTFPRACHAAG